MADRMEDIKAELRVAEAHRSDLMKNMGTQLRLSAYEQRYADHVGWLIAEVERLREMLEWIDVVILALDGAWRAGYIPEEIVVALEEKQRINFAREWFAPTSQDIPVEHVKEADHG